MISNKTNPLIYLLVFIMTQTGCRVGSYREPIVQYSFESEHLVVTNNGSYYTKVPYQSHFYLTPEIVTYQYMVEGRILERIFEIKQTRTSVDHRFYYYTKGVNNLFVLDVGRGTLQVFGSEGGGDRRASFSSHTFLGRADMHLTSPPIDKLPKDEISSINQ